MTPTSSWAAIAPGRCTSVKTRRGLRIEIDPPDTQTSRDLLVSIGRGDVSQMSFGFVVKAGGQIWERDETAG